MTQANTKQETKAGGLADILAAKQKATETKPEPILPLSPMHTPTDNRVKPPLEVEAKLPDDPPAPEHAFRVFNHRYEFKFQGKVLKADEKNIYTPTSGEEFDFLRLQVERGLIHFY